MNETRFYPPRKKGVILHSLTIALLSAFGVFFIVMAFRQNTGGVLALYLILGFLILLPLLVLIYRLYALTHASYEVERDGLRVRWGMRVEEIPLFEIEWVRPMQELGEELPLPFLSTPGALIGSVVSHNLGVVEYMASERQNLVVVASETKILALSPENPDLFTRAFQRAAEMGSLSPLQPTSTQPAAFAIRVWRDKIARILILSNIGATLGLLVLDSIFTIGRSVLSLGYAPDGSLLEPVASSNLLLLPVLALVGTIGDLIAGIFLYHRDQYRMGSYALWGAGAITSLLLVVASLIFVFFS